VDFWCIFDVGDLTCVYFFKLQFLNLGGNSLEYALDIDDRILDFNTSDFIALITCYRAENPARN